MLVHLIEHVLANYLPHDRRGRQHPSILFHGIHDSVAVANFVSYDGTVVESMAAESPIEVLGDACLNLNQRITKKTVFNSGYFL